MAPVPTIEDLRTYLGIESTDAQVGPVLDDALAVAIERITERLSITLVPDPADVPEVVAHAELMLAARLFRRRNSVSGYEGFGDLGFVRVSTLDSDIEQLIERWLAYDFA